MSVLAQYLFANLAASSVDSRLTASDVSNGSLSAFAVASGLGYGTEPVMVANPPANASAAGLAFTANSYMQFTITPQSGKQFSLSSLTFNIARGGASTPRGYDVRTSLDNYAISLAASDVATQRPTFTAVSVDLSPFNYQRLKGAITFRIYLYAQSSALALDVDTIVVNGSTTDVSTTTMFAAEVAEYIDSLGIGVYSTSTPATRNIFVGELPQGTDEAIFIVEAPSPPPHEYIDHEYPVLDFWARSSHTDRAHALLEQVFTNLNRRYGYQTNSWYIYFSRALGTIVDVDRDREGGKLFRLSVQFVTRNLNNVS